ncbi:unnamed protein product, partial [Discosporangium mesarthrocarpum]
GREESIKVLVRIRPLLPSEVEENGQLGVVEVGEDNKLLRVHGAAPNRQLQCCYDAVLGADTTQEAMYAHVKECASAVLEGFNSTIFAYGQTGSGKTYTMFGPNSDARAEDIPATGAGIIPLAIADIFRGLVSIGAKNSGGGSHASVWCSLVQIYNEQVYDMLRDPQRAHPLTIHEEQGAGIYVQGLSEYAVHSACECLQLLRVGSEHRAIRETHMNQASSRSHSIFQIVVEQRCQNEEDGERVLRSKFNLVDLAGSEKWNLKQDMEDARVNEMNNINVSLYTLGRVIATLSTPNGSPGSGKSRRWRPHVPYRDSKLTRLLQDSLGGNTQTRVIATLSPAPNCLDETISTLRFADRAKQVMSFVRINEQRPVDFMLVLRLQAEVKHLRQLLREITEQRGDSRGHGGGAATAVAEAQAIRHQEQIAQLRREKEEMAAQLAAPVPTGGNQDSVSESYMALYTANKDLGAAIEGIVNTLRRFFHFEIEEEELRGEISEAVDRVRATTGG